MAPTLCQSPRTLWYGKLIQGSTAETLGAAATLSWEAASGNASRFDWPPAAHRPCRLHGTQSSDLGASVTSLLLGSQAREGVA